MALRVGTLNVHRWADARNSGNFERIVSLLLPLSLDIVVLQEAGPFTRKPTGGPELAARLGLGHVRVTGDVVLVSRFPLNDRMPLGRQNKRLLLVDVALPAYGGTHGGAFELVCVHLDHRTEERRLGQLRISRGAPSRAAPSLALAERRSERATSRRDRCPPQPPTRGDRSHSAAP